MRPKQYKSNNEYLLVSVLNRNSSSHLLFFVEHLLMFDLAHLQQYELINLIPQTTILKFLGFGKCY